MAEEKDLNKSVDDLAAAKEKYLSANTVISIGGYSFTPAKLMIAGGIISSVLGGLYGAFEVYKDYVGMKKRIAEYVAPDLSELNKKMELTQQNSEKSVEYTQDIKNDLKGDIRRLEDVVDNIERGAKQSQRETDQSVKEVQQEDVYKKAAQESEKLRIAKSLLKDEEKSLAPVYDEQIAKIQKQAEVDAQRIGNAIAGLQALKAQEDYRKFQLEEINKQLERQASLSDQLRAANDKLKDVEFEGAQAQRSHSVVKLSRFVKMHVRAHWKQVVHLLLHLKIMVMA